MEDDKSTVKFTLLQGCPLACLCYNNKSPIRRADSVATRLNTRLPCSCIGPCSGE